MFYLFKAPREKKKTKNSSQQQAEVGAAPDRPPVQLQVEVAEGFCGGLKGLEV